MRPQIRIYLDDFRNPQDSTMFMHSRIGTDAATYTNDNWYVVRNFEMFQKAVVNHAGNISHVSFDHDLAEGHYHKNMQEGVLNYEAEDFSDPANKTGYHCAKFLKEYYAFVGLELPVMYVHSMNPVGTENIINLFK